MMRGQPESAPTSRRRRGGGWWADERGQVGHIEVLPFGLLVFVAAALLVANAWAVIDARLAMGAAAREAARAYVEAPNEAAADAGALARAADVVRGHGRDAARLHLDREVGGGFGRCAPVTIRASYEVPALHLPWIGGFGHSFTVTATHTELVDPYRSGLAGPARC